MEERNDNPIRTQAEYREIFRNELEKTETQKVIVVGHVGAGHSAMIAAHLHLMGTNVEFVELHENNPFAPEPIAFRSRPEIPIIELIDTQYSHLSRKQRDAVIVPIRTEEKIFRNRPCPCGSGKKYKHCCAK